MTRASSASPTIAYPDGVDSAVVHPSTVARLVREAGGDLGAADPAVLLGWMPAPPPWISEVGLRGATIMAGYGVAKAIADGRIRYLPVRLGSVPRLLADVIRPDVAVVSAVRRGDRFAFRGSVGWGPAAVRVARYVVVEVDESAPDLGAPLIEAAPITVVRREQIAPSAGSRLVDDIDRLIGRHVVGLFPDAPTLQFGPGGIAEAIVEAIDRPVSLRSGLVTEAMAGLAARGLLAAPIVAGYPWGGAEIEELAAAGQLVLAPVEVTHDVSAIAAVPRFVACNAALQVGLDGSVNVERVGGRLVAGIGGHADFCAGAARSTGGLSVIALRSTTPKGVPTIVEQVEGVSTPRCDVDVVVTEHGVADLRDADDAERRRRLLAIDGNPLH